jgi:hypothetical protein
LGLKLDNTGGAIALMTWLYWTGVALLLGAELNCELAKVSAQGKIEEKHEPPPSRKLILRWHDRLLCPLCRRLRGCAKPVLRENVIAG